jgi:hypothetical protein
MKLALVLATTSVAFAAAPATAAPAFEGPMAVLQDIMEEVFDKEASESLYEADRKAYDGAALIDLEEESTEETFRCRLTTLLNTRAECLR